MPDGAKKPKPAERQHGPTMAELDRHKRVKNPYTTLYNRVAKDGIREQDRRRGRSVKARVKQEGVIQAVGKGDPEFRTFLRGTQTPRSR